MLLVRRFVISLLAGSLFGLVMSTKIPGFPALFCGAAAAAFMGGSLAYIDHTERRNAARRGEGDDECEA